MGIIKISHRLLWIVSLVLIIVRLVPILVVPVYHVILGIIGY